MKIGNSANDNEPRTAEPSWNICASPWRAIRVHCGSLLHGSASQHCTEMPEFFVDLFRARDRVSDFFSQ